MRIFVTPLVAGEVVVRGDEQHYLAHVRRSRPGDVVELVDGAGHHAIATIVRIGEGEAMLAVGAIDAIAEPPPHVRVLLPVIKGDRMESCLEKLVEVGASEIVVWPAARAVVRIEADRFAARLARYQATALAAARQSRRATVPSVTAAASLAAAIAALPSGARYVLEPTGTRTALAPTTADVTLASGPEGGLAPAEHTALTDAGFLSIDLGPRTLRAETAPVVAVALVRAATIS
jgi:16S rRNA (uracil1498-N3)-methyltransferase